MTPAEGEAFFTSAINPILDAGCLMLDAEVRSLMLEVSKKRPAKIFVSENLVSSVSSVRYRASNRKSVIGYWTLDNEKKQP